MMVDLTHCSDSNVAETGLLGRSPEDLILRVAGGSRDGQIVRLSSRKCAVGSSYRCTLRLRAGGVRPLHCLILRGERTSIIRRWSEDTRLNGRTFIDSPLQIGDRISVGPVELDVLAGVAEQPPDDTADHARLELAKSAAQTAENRRHYHRRLRRLVDRLRLARSQARKLEELDALERELAEERRELDSSRSELQSAQAQRENQRTAWENESAQLRRDLDQQAGKLAQQRNQFEEKQRQFQAREQDVKRQQREMEQQFEQQRRQDAEAIQRQHAELERQRGQDSEELQRRHDEIQQLQQRLTNEREDLQRRQQQSQAKQEAAEKGLTARRIELDAEQQRLAEQQEQLNTRQSELEQFAVRQPPATAESPAEPSSGAASSSPPSRRAAADSPFTPRSSRTATGATPATADDDRFTQPTTAPPVSTADVIARLRGLPSNQPEVAAAEEPAPEMPPDVHSADTAGLEEDSIENYMSKLLDRVRGRSETAAEARASSSPRSPAKVASPPTAPAASPPAEPARLKTEDLRPRRLAPEMVSDIAAMRELANTAAHSAIDSHATRKRWVRAITGKAIVALAGLTAGVALLTWSGYNDMYLFLGGIIGLLIATFWGLQCALLSRGLAHNSREKSRQRDRAKEKSGAVDDPR